MEFLHRVDRVAEVLEGVVRSKDPDLAKRPAFVGSSGDQSTDEDGLQQPEVTRRVLGYSVISRGSK
jgi:hypothetical protein